MSERTTSGYVAALYRIKNLNIRLDIFPRIVFSSFYSSNSSLHPSNFDMQATSSDDWKNYRGPVELSSFEVKWRDRQSFLESKGYMLRPRLRPGWTPSWLTTGQDYFTCEDSARLPVSLYDGLVENLISLD